MNDTWKNLKDSHPKETCFVIGNGKSLAKETNLFLKSYPSFGSNRVYLKFIPTYYAVINPLVAGQYKEDIEKLKTTKFITDKVPIKGAIPLRSNNIMAFSREPNLSICEGFTVTYVLLQLAFFMGFTTVYLVGVDHDYTFEGQPNEQNTAPKVDVNHFDPNYFSGVQWNNPDLVNSERAYRIADRVFRADHRQIYNITPGSKLDVFPFREEV